MRRAYASMVALAAVCLIATAGCDRRGRTAERDPAPPAPPAAVTTEQPPPPPQEPAAAVEQTRTDLDSVDQVLNEIDSDLSSVDATPPDAD